MSQRAADVTPARVSVLLTCYQGAATARKERRSLLARLRDGGASLIDEVVFRVDAKGIAQVHDPHRDLAGMLTAALTWGLFGLAASGTGQALVIWAVIGAVCGGLFSYYTEHALTKHELARVGSRIGPDSSAILTFVRSLGAAQLLTAVGPSNPTTASVATIDSDLSASVTSSPSSRVQGAATTPSTAPGQQDDSALLAMLITRYPGQRTARTVLSDSAGERAASDSVQVELLIEVDAGGRRHVSDPSQGVKAMSKSDVISWGGFGLVVGAVAGLSAGGGILGFLEDGLVTGVAWAVFGLAAGALYGLWAGRAVSARRLKGVGALLPPDTSAVVAWAAGSASPDTVAALSAPGAHQLAIRFHPVARGSVLLEV